MNKFEKIKLSISCFSPLYVILALKNGIELYSGISSSCKENSIVIFNSIIIAIWIVLIAFSLSSLLIFKKSFLEAEKCAKEEVRVIGAKNITSDHYFTYFSVLF